MRNVIITGGAGFIGSNAVDLFAQDEDYRCTAVVDKLTYAANQSVLAKHEPNVSSYKLDIADASWSYIFDQVKPDVIINFAAESHVDNSLIADMSKDFIKSNYVGVVSQVNAIREYFHKYQKRILLLHVSTDEVLGDLPLDSNSELEEDAPLCPNNVYSATKAAAEQMLQAMYHTYRDFDFIIVRATNNYGPNQHFEKFIPTVISSVLENKKIPVYGDGKNVREWLWVGDFVEGIRAAIHHHFSDYMPRKSGEIYHFGSGQRVPNITVVKKILKIMGKSEDLIKYVLDRPGHDRKYALNSRKAHEELGWSATKRFEKGLELTIENVKQRMKHGTK